MTVNPVNSIFDIFGLLFWETAPTELLNPTTNSTIDVPELSLFRNYFEGTECVKYFSIKVNKHPGFNFIH